MIEIDDERKLRIFYDKRMSQEVKADILGDEFKGYSLKIMGGNDKQGFPMKQGVLVPQRVRLLLSKGHSCYRPRRTGERKRKSVRGCIVAQVSFLFLNTGYFCSLFSCHSKGWGWYSRVDWCSSPKAIGTKACQQNSCSLPSHQGRWCPQVRYPSWSFFQERRNDQLQGTLSITHIILGSKDPTSCYPIDSSTQASLEGRQEEQHWEECCCCCRICYSSRSKNQGKKGKETRSRQ